MQPLEAVIRQKFILQLLGEKNPISDTERKLFALPVKLGGLAIDNPVSDTQGKFEQSVKLTSELMELIGTSAREYSVESASLRILKRSLRETRKLEAHLQASELRKSLTPEMQRAMDVAEEKGVSTIFSVKPLEKHGFTFESKRDFRFGPNEVQASDSRPTHHLRMW